MLQLQFLSDANTTQAQQYLQQFQNVWRTTTPTFTGRAAHAGSCCRADNIRRGNRVFPSLSISLCGRLRDETDINGALRMQVYDMLKEENESGRRRKSRGVRKRKETETGWIEEVM
nr:hypothetical protein CFP56_73092 [Quercus suber]